MRSARGGTTRQPRIVPIDNRPVPSEAIFTAVATAIPCFLARVMMAVGSYTAPAHRPTIATVSRAALTMVRRRYCALKICASGLTARAGPGGARPDPALGFLYFGEDIERRHHGHQPAQEHGAPAIVRADGEVQRGGQKKPRV